MALLCVDGVSYVVVTSASLYPKNFVPCRTVVERRRIGCSSLLLRKETLFSGPGCCEALIWDASNSFENFPMSLTTALRIPYRTTSLTHLFCSLSFITLQVCYSLWIHQFGDLLVVHSAAVSIQIFVGTSKNAEIIASEPKTVKNREAVTAYAAVRLVKDS